MGQSVFATTVSTDCWCGNLLPPASSKVDDSSCNDPCAGYDVDMCGGVGFFSVYLSGTTDKVANADGPVQSSTASATTPSATTPVKPSVVTVGGQTIVVTATGSTANAPTSSSSLPSSPSSSSGGPSKAGIAAGVVVGIVAISAIAGGAFLFFRNRKRREVEEEYRKNAAASSFIAGGKPPTSSGGVSLNDTRLDPAVMAQRRMSDGSIADNQDYSRRILKVTNA
jgi:cell wall integrity and stress response component